MHKIIVFISAILLFSCKQNEKLVDERQVILTSEFSGYDNFFPIASLDLTSKGVKDKIHVMYVSFDPGPNYESAFSKGENIDRFSFKISENGKYRPMFNKTALGIGGDFKDFFKEDLESYRSAKKNDDLSELIDFAEEPGWWQYDETPLNSKGKPMRFICQVDMGRILVNDDCRLYVFYDEIDRVVKYVYQRT